jgi:hypothetical protein
LSGEWQAVFFNNLDGVARNLLSLVKHYENHSSRIGEKQFYDDINQIQLKIEKSFFDNAEIVNGGIDLNINKLNLDNKGDGSVVVQAFDPAMLAQFESAPGLVPLMMGIRSVQDLPAFLGFSQTPDP